MLSTHKVSSWLASIFLLQHSHDVWALLRQQPPCSGCTELLSDGEARFGSFTLFILRFQVAQAIFWQRYSKSSMQSIRLRVWKQETSTIAVCKWFLFQEDTSLHGLSHLVQCVVLRCIPSTSYCVNLLQGCSSSLQRRRYAAGRWLSSQCTAAIPSSPDAHPWVLLQIIPELN